MTIYEIPGNDPERIRKHIEMEADDNAFIYKGIQCEIRRTRQSHFVGYIIIPNITKKQCQIISNNIHGGITYQEHDKIGFDADHNSDVSIKDFELESIFPDIQLLSPHASYKTMAYMEREIKTAIDKLLEIEGD